MKEFSKKDLQEISGSSLHNADKIPGSLKNVKIDSRKVENGDVFVAIKGDTHDAHDFINSVEQNGASAIIVNESWYRENGNNFPNVGLLSVPDSNMALRELGRIYRNKFNIPVIAITGTNGKTTTKEMTAFVLSKKLNTIRSEGNFNNFFGLPLTLFKLTDEHEAIVLEMGASYPGEIKGLCEIANPDYGIITSIGRGHIEFYKTIEEVVKTKTVLLTQSQKLGFINGDDENLKKFRSDKVKSFGFDSSNDLFVTNYSLKDNACYSFTDNFGIEFELNAPGKVNIYNALAAISIGRELSLSDREIQHGVSEFTSYKQRMELKIINGVNFINDTYNANPDSVKSAMEILEDFKTEGKKVIVLGDMLELGEDSEANHSEIGFLVAYSNVDLFLTTGNDTLFAHEAAKNRIESLHLTNHTSIAEVLKETLSPNDVVLVKGSRGSKMELVLDKYLEITDI